MDDIRDKVIRLEQTVVSQTIEITRLKEKHLFQEKTVNDLRLASAAQNGYRRGVKGATYILFAVMGGAGIKVVEWIWRNGG